MTKKSLSVIGIFCIVSLCGCGEEEIEKPIDEPVEESVVVNSLIGTWHPERMSVRLSEEHMDELRSDYENYLIENPDVTLEAWLEEGHRRLEGNRLYFGPPEPPMKSGQFKFIPDGTFQWIIKGTARITKRVDDVEVLHGWTLGVFASGTYNQKDNNLALTLANVRYKFPEEVEGNPDFEEQIRRSGALEETDDIEEARVAFRQMIAGESGIVQYTFNEDQTQLITTNDVGVEWIWQRAEFPAF